VIDNITIWVEKTCNTERGKQGYRSRIRAFRKFVRENFNLDIEEFKQKWREAKYSGVREREQFLDSLNDILTEYEVFLKQEDYAPTYVSHRLSIAGSYLKKGCGIKELDIELPKNVFVKYHNRDIKKEEIRKILEHSPLRERLFFLMMIESGLRPDTLTRLRYWMIKEDYEANRIPMMIRLPSSILKNRIPDRFSFLGEDGVRLLREYLSTREESHDDDLIFLPEAKGRMKKPVLSPETFSNKFSELVLKLGLDEAKRRGKPKSIRMYCLRKYFLNGMRCDSTYRSYWFCHKSIDDHYISRDVDRHREEYMKGYPSLKVYEPSESSKVQELEIKLDEAYKTIGQLQQDLTKTKKEILEEMFRKWDEYVEAHEKEWAEQRRKASQFTERAK